MAEKGKTKVAKVLHESKHGTLKSPSGAKVKTNVFYLCTCQPIEVVFVTHEPGPIRPTVRWDPVY